MITLEQFKLRTLGSTVPKPHLDYQGDGLYPGQCVSYVRQYMEQVLGISTHAWGNAVDYWTNPDVLQYFDKLKPGATPKNGDIGVYGNDPGNWTGPEGHIFIYDNGRMLNQNYNGSLKVSIDPIFSPGFLGYLRLKGSKVPTTLYQARIIAHGVGGWNGYDGKPNALTGAIDDKLKKNQVGKPLDEVLQHFYDEGSSGVNWRNKRLPSVYNDRAKIQKVKDLVK